MILGTPRLIIRDFDEDDIKDVFEYLSDDDVMKYIEPIMTYEQVVIFIKNAGLQKKLIFAIVLRRTNKVIGHLIFHKYGNKNTYEIGWIINKKYWNKGYTQELSNKIIKYGFETLSIKKIIGETVKENRRVIKLFEKLNMKEVGMNEDGLIEYEIKNNKIEI
jgi:RimJ/RimL family protein N-acetyltransferase